MFVDADKYADPAKKEGTNIKGRCQYLYKFFLQNWDLKKDAKMNVKVAKDKEKLPKSGKFEMVDGVYDWSSWNLKLDKKPIVPRLLDWVGTL
jgi:hypothetical protein